MLGTLLFSLLAEMVFGAASTTGRSYQREFRRYLTQRRFAAPTVSAPKTP